MKNFKAKLKPFDNIATFKSSKNYFKTGKEPLRMKQSVMSLLYERERSKKLRLVAQIESCKMEIEDSIVRHGIGAIGKVVLNGSVRKNLDLIEKIKDKTLISRGEQGLHGLSCLLDTDIPNEVKRVLSGKKVK